MKSESVCILKSFLTRDRIEPGFTGLSSVRFDFILLRLVRVRFGSSLFLKNRFGFGSVRFDYPFEKTVRVRFGSTSFLKSRFEFGSDRFEPNRTVIVRFVFDL